MPCWRFSLPKEKGAKAAKISGPPLRPRKDRLMEKVKKSNSGCWIWTGQLSRGYATMSVRCPDGSWRPKQAYRIAYEEFIGAIPPGLQIDHLCRNKKCVNPKHLEPVTGEENLRRHWRLLRKCKHGHPFVPENTLRLKKHPNQRICRICSIRRTREQRAKAKDHLHRADAMLVLLIDAQETVS